MLEALHQHLLSELERAAKADTIFVVGAVLYNILTMFVAWALTGTREEPVVFYLFLIGAVIFTTIALLALSNGRKTHDAYHSALMRMYADNQIEKYFPEGSVGTGITRHRLYTVAVSSSGFLAVAVPLLSL